MNKLHRKPNWQWSMYTHYYSNAIHQRRPTITPKQLTKRGATASPWIHYCKWQKFTDYRASIKRIGIAKVAVLYLHLFFTCTAEIHAREAMDCWQAGSQVWFDLGRAVKVMSVRQQWAQTQNIALQFKLIFVYMGVNAADMMGGGLKGLRSTPLTVLSYTPFMWVRMFAKCVSAIKSQHRILPFCSGKDSSHEISHVDVISQGLSNFESFRSSASPWFEPGPSSPENGLYGLESTPKFESYTRI